MKTKSSVWVLFTILFILLFNIKNVFALQIKNIHVGTKVSDPYWIEVLNDTGAIDDLSDYGILSYKPGLSKPETNHRISKRNESDNLSVEDNTTFYISNSKIEPSISERVFYSAFSVAANGGTISITDKDDKILTCISYKNVNCSNQNSENGNTNSSSTNSTSTASSTNSENELIKYIYVPVNNQDIYGDIKVLLPKERVVPAAADVQYTLKAIDSNKNVIAPLDFHWSFGDGGEKFGKDVSYTYIYPGDYTLIATADGYTSGGQARMDVKVIHPDLKIIRVGLGEKDNVIDIENKTEHDLFLSGFRLKIDGKIYMLPKNLLIAKKKTVRLSGEAIGFKLPATNVSLLYPNENPLISYVEEINFATDTSVISTEALDILGVSSGSLINISVSDIANLIPKTSSQNIVVENSVKRIVKNPIKSSNNIEKTKQIKDTQNKDFIIVKKLILKNDSKTPQNHKVLNKVVSENNKPVENNNKNVDTGIINWLKSLIY